MSKRGWLLFLAMGVIWGVPYLFIRVAVSALDPVVVAFGRTLVGAMLLLPVAAHRGLLEPVLPHWRWLIVFTLVEISVPWLMLGHAETRLNSSTTGLLLAIVPLIAAIVVTKLGHDRLDTRRMLGLGIGLAGVAALVGLDIDLSDLAAVGAVAICAVGYATGPIIIDRKLKGVPPLGVVAGSLLLAAVLYAPFAWLKWPPHSTWPAWGSVATLGVVCTTLAFILFFALIAEVGPARATVITYINPVVAIALGVALLNEPLTVGMSIGFPLVIAGSVLGTARK
jgi:drug/metabolite transporter (DMT)-like permease